MVSICIFGSQARRTADGFSDRDVLLLGNSGAKLEPITKEWQSAGWNITTFSRPAFKRMAGAKALFVQHLKQEGCIIRDDGDFLASMLQDFSPKPSYESEKRDALEYLSLLPALGESYWLNLCIGDITYVIFRNVLVLHLASRGTYVFDYERLVSAIATEFKVPQIGREALVKLREMKHTYRGRRHDASILSWLPIARDAAAAISEQLMPTGESSIARGDTTDAYYQLRNAELELVQQYDPRWLDRLQPHEKGFMEWKLICNSGGYPKPKGMPMRGAGVSPECSVGPGSISSTRHVQNDRISP